MAYQSGQSPQAGAIVELEPGIRRILAPNPSPMTLHGTNTYILGTNKLAIIDPGPDHPDHLRDLMDATAGAEITAILVTHSHLDHSPLAARLAARTGAPVLAFGNAITGRSDRMTELANSALAGGGEGVDAAFCPDRCLEDGETIKVDGSALKAVWTPGHMSNHLCFELGDAVFTGDHVMGWASSLVSPPDGDLTAFMQSCARLRQRTARVYYPGHGDKVGDPHGRLDWLIEHRLSREAQILDALSDGPAGVDDLTARLYADVQAALIPAASRNVLAHLIDLLDRQRICLDGPVGTTATYSLAPNSPDEKIV